MARAIQEYDIQRALVLWLDGTSTRASALRPGVVYWHTPNSGEGRDALQGMRLKQQGVKPGVHDLLFLWGGLYGLELKKPNGKPAETQLSDAQKDMHPRMLAAGMVASATVDNLQAARAVLFGWGLTVNNA